MSVTDTLGNMSSQYRSSQQYLALQYSPLNLVTQVTDPKGNNTTFSYDPNGNLLSLTDALHLTTPTTWTYDNMDQVLTRASLAQLHQLSNIESWPLSRDS